MNTFISLDTNGNYSLTVKDTVEGSGTITGFDILIEDFDFDTATAVISALEGLAITADGDISMNDDSTSLAWAITL